MKLALSTMWWGEGATPVEELVGSTRRLGFECIELEYRRPAGTLPRLRQALADAGIAVGSVHAPFPHPGGSEDALRQADLSADEPAARRRAEELVARTLEHAAEWGAGVVVLHSGGMASLLPLGRRMYELCMAGQSDTAEFRQLRAELMRLRADEAPRRLDWVRQALGRLVPRALALKVTIGLENRAYYRDLPGLEEMGLLLDEFGPAVGYWHDLGHAFRLDLQGFVPQEEWLRRYGNRLVGMHIHDSRLLDDHQPPGYGQIPLERLALLFPPQGLRVLEVRADFSEADIGAGLAHLRARKVLP